MNLYLVAEIRGGVPEQPSQNAVNKEIIKAETRQEAVDIYNKKNNCDYYYGSVLAKNKDGEVSVLKENLTTVSDVKRLEY